MGVEIGKVIKSQNNYVDILLTADLNINDGIRFIDDDIGFIVTSLFKNKKRIDHAKKAMLSRFIVKIKSVILKWLKRHALFY